MAGTVRRIPVHRAIAGLIRDPLGTFRTIGRESGGEIVLLDLGLFRPYLISRPDHVQHILRDHQDIYLRTGMIWTPLRRLFGDGIGGEGPVWAERRGIVQPLFSAKNITALMDQLCAAIEEAVTDLDDYARTGTPFDLVEEMNKVVHRVLVRVFFGGEMSTSDVDRVGRAIADAFNALGARMLLPSVPDSVPMPGDRTFRRSNRIADDVLLPLISERRQRGADGRDMVSLLCQARDEDGNGLDDRQVRDDVVALFSGGTETVAATLSWLWVILDMHPDIAERLYDEIDRVVGPEGPRGSDVARLEYTKMVLSELLRLHPAGWIIPRRANRDDIIDGITIRAGNTVLVSPYLTHRLPSLWERPEEFDPERFSPGRAGRRQKLSYIPFGVGGHQCLGSHFFMVEAQLLVAGILSRYRPELRAKSPVVPSPSATLRPRGNVPLLLRPIERDQSVTQPAS